jgi:heme exporter protein D
MNTVWVALALGIAGVIFLLITSLRRRTHPTDLGAVSHQWIAEHRAASGQDSRR